MAWYYVLNGASHGPVAEADLRNLRAQNVVALDTPVWTEGMAEWLPFSSSTLASVGAASPASVAVTAAPVGETHTCVECGKLFPEDEMLNYEGSWVCGADKTAFFQRIKEGVASKGTYVYASFWRRLAAYILDVIIISFVISIPIIILSIAFAASIKGAGGKPEMPAWFIVVILFLYLLPPAFEIFMVGKFGATPGKMAMGLKVIRPDGSGISYLRSTGRFFSKIISAMIVYIGFLMIFWDEEKCSLHDRMCQTRVIKVPRS